MKCFHYHLHLQTYTCLNYSVPGSALVMSMKKAMGLGTEKALSASPTNTVPGFGVWKSRCSLGYRKHLLTPCRASVTPPPILVAALQKMGTWSHKWNESYNLPRTPSQQSIPGANPRGMGRNGDTVRTTLRAPHFLTAAGWLEALECPAF